MRLKQIDLTPYCLTQEQYDTTTFVHDPAKISYITERCIPNIYDIIYLSDENKLSLHVMPNNETIYGWYIHFEIGDGIYVTAIIKKETREDNGVMQNCIVVNSVGIDGQTNSLRFGPCLIGMCIDITNDGIYVLK